MINEETIEEYFLGKMKEVLLFGNDAQAIRFMEKYFEAKLQQERMYSEKEVELIANEMVNWAIDNVGNPNPQSGRKFDEVISKFKKK